MKSTLTRCAALLAVSPLLFGGVKTDYDRGTNFATYHTFSWKGAHAHSATGAIDNSLVQSRIETAVDEQLAKKGLRESAENPDVFLIYKVGAKQIADREYMPDYGFRRRWGGTVFVNRYTEGTVVLDMVDAKTKQLVWRAVCSTTGKTAIDTQKPGNINKMVADAFKHYPPKS